jgi:hypothetical protein
LNDNFLKSTGFTASDGTVFEPLTSPKILAAAREPAQQFLAAVQENCHPVPPAEMIIDAIKACSMSRNDLISVTNCSIAGHNLFADTKNHSCGGGYETARHGFRETSVSLGFEL